MNERQKRVLEFLKDFIEDNQYPPSVRDIQEGASIKSTSTVSTDLKKLEELGYIKRSNQTSRGIEIIGDKTNKPSTTSSEEVIDIPVLGNVAAGNPILAIEDVDNYFPVPSYMAARGDYFMLRIKGDSMIEAGMLEGDLILVKKTHYAEHGQIVVALIDDSATVKRLYKKNNQIMLLPENSSMEPIIPDHMTILGKVVSLFRESI